MIYAPEIEFGRHITGRIVLHARQVAQLDFFALLLLAPDKTEC